MKKDYDMNKPLPEHCTATKCSENIKGKSPLACEGCEHNKNFNPIVKSEVKK
jgi:hypothetical protein